MWMCDSQIKVDSIMEVEGPDINKSHCNKSDRAFLIIKRRISYQAKRLYCTRLHGKMGNPPEGSVHDMGYISS